MSTDSLQSKVILRARRLFGPARLAIAVAVLLAAPARIPEAARAAPAAPLPAALRRLAADPRPGTLLPATAAAVPVILETLSEASGFGTARGVADGRAYAFRLLPYTALWRFGEPGAQAEEFSTGERVFLKLYLPPGEPDGAGYALEIRDAISEQEASGRWFRMLRQDRDNYRFEVEPVGGQDAIGVPLLLAYGPETVLVLRETPLYTFRVPAGTRLRLNMGRRDGSPVPVAREVLDEPSQTRFRAQQRLRLLARADARGAAGYVVERAGTGATVRLFPEFAGWARRLQVGDRVALPAPGTVTEVAGAGRAASVGEVRADNPGARLVLTGVPARLQVNSPIRERPVRTGVSFDRDVRPLLEVNCLTCHRDGAAQSGFSLSSAAALRRGGRRGPAVVPGRSAASFLYLLLTGERNPPMPPDRKFTPEQLAIVRAWIDAGAPWEDPKPAR